MSITILENPIISGSGDVGLDLDLYKGLYSGLNNDFIITNQWLVDGLPVSGETGSTYTVRAVDVGLDISCEVTVVNPTRDAGNTVANTLIFNPTPQEKPTPFRPIML